MACDELQSRSKSSMFSLYLILTALCVSVSCQQRRPRIISGPSHPLIVKRKGVATFNWTFGLRPTETWNDSIYEVCFGIWKSPGYLTTKLMVIGNHGEVSIRRNYESKISCKFNMSRLQVSFTVHNLSREDENNYGLHVELMTRSPLTDTVTLRLEDPRKLPIHCRGTLPRSDSGVYLCKAYNKAGEDRKEVIVTVSDHNDESPQITVLRTPKQASEEISPLWTSLLVVSASIILIMLTVLLFRSRGHCRRNIPYSPQIDTETHSMRSTIHATVI
ncbi:hypothetical protein OS493_019431 [Desmophyllum pertusum]|uniref:Ig-like domain-containing protein n=1 Tax=Desmophyllum pertusum TaxID=174260 RepID=A0A9X0A484_9CNID|nr:hypothetical protein OS493_019431 [Desmophyllum pertusum]